MCFYSVKRIALALISLCVAIINPLYEHGFSAETLIWTQPTLIWIKSDLYNSASYGGQTGDWKTIQAVCKGIVHESADLFTPSYDIIRGVNRSHAEFQQLILEGWVRINGATRSATNCYMRITLGDRPHETILCTPLQEFYVPAMRKWISAIDLEPSHELLNSYEGRFNILKVELVMEPLEVYAISVDAPHTYFISIRRALTHNIFLPAIECTAVIPWDLVFTGGKVALELGPATCGISIALAAGAGIGYAIYQLSKGSAEISTYGVDFNVEGINTYFSKKGRRSLGNGNNSSTHSGSCSSGAPHHPEDPKKRNTDKVGNMYELFEREGFGQALRDSSEFTNRMHDGARVFRMTTNLVEYGLEEGDLFYLDMQHKSHIEVFNRTGKVVRDVLRLNGTRDMTSLLRALKDVRKI